VELIKYSVLDRTVTELVCIIGKTLGVKITVGKISIISFIEGSCYGPASSLAGPTRTSCCDEHTWAGLLRASVGAHAVPLYMQVAILRVKEAEFSLFILFNLYTSWEISINSIHTTRDPFVIPCFVRRVTLAAWGDLLTGYVADSVNIGNVCDGGIDAKVWNAQSSKITVFIKI
jgi:hypothetical protein